MTYQNNYPKNCYQYQPRRPVKSFQDLEVYQKLLGVCVMVVKRINSSPSSRPASAPRHPGEESTTTPGSVNDSGQARMTSGGNAGIQPGSRLVGRDDTGEGGIAAVAESTLSPTNVLPRNDVIEKLAAKLTDTLLALPVMISSAHSIRFSDQDEAVKKLEEAMLYCNLAVVYLEQFRDLGQTEIETAFFDEQIKTLLAARGKVLHLQMSWKKFFGEKQK